MNIEFKQTNKSIDAAEFISSSVIKELNNKKKVLLFVSGGSSIDVAVIVSKLLIQSEYLYNLTVLLTDERFGEVSHKDSNFLQLTEKGFNISKIKMIPVLQNEDRDVTINKYSSIIEQELSKADYKIGLFGIGTDGHTAGILPNSEALHSDGLVCGYDTPTFSRITITPKVIEKIDEAVVWAQGENKIEALKNLTKEMSINLEPAQILKKVPLLTIFTNEKF